MGDAQVADEDDDQHGQDHADIPCAEPESAETLCLAGPVGERGAERPREDVGDPEGGDRVESEPPWESWRLWAALGFVESSCWNSGHGL